MGAIPYEPDRDEQWDDEQDDDASRCPLASAGSSSIVAAPRCSR